MAGIITGGSAIVGGGTGAGGGGGGGSMAIGGAITGASDGSILFVGTGGVLAQDALLSWDDTDNQLVLHPGSAAKPSLILGDDTSGFFSPATNQVAIATAGVSRWFVNATGSLLATTENQVDIGGQALNRPRDGYFSRDLYAGGSLRLGTGATAIFTISNLTNIVNYNATTSTYGHKFGGATVANSGAQKFFELTPGSHTSQTLSTEISGFLFNTFTRQWATGALTNQREVTINAPTYAFVGASTITNAATLYVSNAPIAGTNATITNSWAAWFGAKVRIDAAVALGAGGAATLGATGGTGPTAAAQVEWVEVWTQNGKRFFPAWA